jgi:hypothetical protein
MMAEYEVENSGNPPGWNKEFQWGLTVGFVVTVWGSPAMDGESAVLYGDIANHEGLIIFSHPLDLEEDAFDDLMVEQHRQDTIEAFIKTLSEVDLDMMRYE